MATSTDTLSYLLKRAVTPQSLSTAFLESCPTMNHVRKREWALAGGWRRWPGNSLVDAAGNTRARGAAYAVVPIDGELIHAIGIGSHGAMRRVPDAMHEAALLLGDEMEKHLRGGGVERTQDLAMRDAEQGRVGIAVSGMNRPAIGPPLCTKHEDCMLHPQLSLACAQERNLAIRPAFLHVLGVPHLAEEDGKLLRFVVDHDIALVTIRVFGNLVWEL